MQSYRLGLVVLENRLKPDTAAIVNQLLDADIRTVMVTGNSTSAFQTLVFWLILINFIGDNLLTAISVARGNT